MLRLFHKHCHFTRYVGLWVCVCGGRGRIILSLFMCSCFPLFSQEDTRTSTLNTLNFALRWKPSTRAELKPRRESTATARSFLTTNQITIRYGNTLYNTIGYSLLHPLPVYIFNLIQKKKTHPSPADNRETCIWHQPIKRFSCHSLHVIFSDLHCSPTIFIGLCLIFGS